MKSTKQINSFYSYRPDLPSRAAIFLSGSGTNAEKILEWRQRQPQPSYHVAALITDRPQTSRARFLAEQHQLPLIENDIAAFYRNQGLTRVSLATAEGRQAREMWTATLRAQIAPLAIDFGIFAGFVPLTNLTADFPCLNIHPGDLTYRKNGQRYLVGLHTVPIERAILEGLGYLRSTVILAEPYHDNPNRMDSGLILGVSEKVPIDWQGQRLLDLQLIAAQRPLLRPVNGYDDILEHVAVWNQKRLKEQGDWIVFPRLVEDFSQGKFGKDAEGQLYYCLDDGNWQEIQPIIYSQDKKEIPLVNNP